MSAISHTDWTILCDHDDCMAQLRTDLEELMDGNATSLRRIGKRRGWAVAIPTGRERRADYCPKHKPSADRGERYSTPAPPAAERGAR